MRHAKRARDILREMPINDILQKMKKAGELYAKGTLPLGDGTQSPDEFARTLANTVAAFRSAHPDMIYEGVGVSLPGRVDESGMLVFAPNLKWPSVNLRRLLESTIDLPVVLENAASACALAELWFGRHPDNVKDLVAVTVSEGVGVGLLLNAQLFHGTGSLAGELGHVTLDDDGPRCSCGKRGCWEQYASNAAALARYNSNAVALARHTSGPDTGRKSGARSTSRPVRCSS